MTRFVRIIDPASPFFDHIGKATQHPECKAMDTVETEKGKFVLVPKKDLGTLCLQPNDPVICETSRSIGQVVDLGLPNDGSSTPRYVVQFNGGRTLILQEVLVKIGGTPEPTKTTSYLAMGTEVETPTIFNTGAKVKGIIRDIRWVNHHWGYVYLVEFPGYTGLKALKFNEVKKVEGPKEFQGFRKGDKVEVLVSDQYFGFKKGDVGEIVRTESPTSALPNIVVKLPCHNSGLAFRARELKLLSSFQKGDRVKILITDANCHLTPGMTGTVESLPKYLTAETVIVMVDNMRKMTFKSHELELLPKKEEPSKNKFKEGDQVVLNYLKPVWYGKGSFADQCKNEVGVVTIAPSEEEKYYEVRFPSHSLTLREDNILLADKEEQMRQERTKVVNAILDFYEKYGTGSLEWTSSHDNRFYGLESAVQFLAKRRDNFTWVK